VSSLSSLGFKASFGQLNIANLSEKFFPLIAFTQAGEAVIVSSAPVDSKISIINPVSRKKEELSTAEFKSDFSQYAIIAKELNEREKEERSGHWFFSAFRKSKWIYVQVMIAAMVSNFLSLTTALFTMTVYDRVIPNGAFESLIALSIGVIIALAFDFLIKSLRASFVDTASKRADLEISRRLFERILTLTPTEQRQKNWCYGWYNS
jgi:ATP-binding cassette subfamily C protein LapB